MTFRIIARLDIKPPNLVKGVHLEGLRKIGVPEHFAEQYFLNGIDEINYQDIVASLYDRNSISYLVSETASNVFVPITVGGGVRTLSDANSLIRAGADKISINTAAVRNPEILSELSKSLGQQAIVLNVEAKFFSGLGYMVMIDSGREHTGKSVSQWLMEANNFGFGELLLTSVDKEGTMQGFDQELFELARKIIDVPILLHGGFGNIEDILSAAKSGADGAVIASILHYKKIEIQLIKETLYRNNIEVRM